MKRLLIVAASAGAGHLRAAQALEETAREQLSNWEIQNVDILSFTSSLYRKVYAQGYQNMVDRAPALWGMLYRATEKKKSGNLTKKISHGFNKIEFSKFRHFVRDWHPDCVIATHFLPGQVFEHYRRRNRDRFPFWMVLTDYDAHAFWAQPSVDQFFVGNEETKAILSSHGIAAAKIQISGIPIVPAFSKKRNRNEIRKDLGLGSNIPTILIMGGGAGVGSLEQAVQIAFECGRVQVLAVTGRNQKLQERLQRQKRKYKNRLYVLGLSKISPHS